MASENWRGLENAATSAVPLLISPPHLHTWPPGGNMVTLNISRFEWLAYEGAANPTLERLKMSTDFSHRRSECEICILPPAPRLWSTLFQSSLDTTPPPGTPFTFCLWEWWPWYGAVLGAAASLNLSGQAGTIDRGSVRAARIGKACEHRTFPAKAPRIFKSVMTTPDSFFPFSDSKPSGSPLKNACS